MDVPYFELDVGVLKKAQERGFVIYVLDHKGNIFLTDIYQFKWPDEHGHAFSPVIYGIKNLIGKLKHILEGA